MDQLEQSPLAPQHPFVPAPSGLKRWWSLVDTRIGIIPLPLYPVILVLMAAFVWLGKLPPDLTMMIPLLALGAFTCAEIGRRLPVLHNFGAAAILATFLPSYLTYAQVLPAPVVKAVTDFNKASNFLYLFIACIIVGSILGMNRRILVAGFLKIFVPLGLGSIVAACAGTLVGWLLGLGARHSLFFIVIPIMGGGIGEGALPISIGYGSILGIPQGDVFAQVLPAVMLGSLCAIILAASLNHLGHLHPHLTGEGRLHPEGDGMETITESEEDRPTGPPVDPMTVGAAGVTAITLYLAGTLVFDLTGFPAPVTMLFVAVALKLSRLVSPHLREGAGVVYRFFQTCVTYPLLFAIGVAMTPWNTLVGQLQPAYLLTIFATVAAIMSTGFVVARFIGMYPIDTAIVNACHSGQGGTGDVAILTAANRMALMPFAQIATRIGGAITITVALTVLRAIS